LFLYFRVIGHSIISHIPFIQHKTRCYRSHLICTTGGIEIYIALFQSGISNGGGRGGVHGADGDFSKLFSEAFQDGCQFKETPM
jgi:hypothetical protein